ncbi:2-dehydropantoate 2-reductase [Grosmannia clavigera kw1407]|uniref:2-dehydropantoate 2-reductase n=1 Tax=Grosmannia clavigera (strain kw1407 / UAMH 11150) TaxID=655863 RepID=F0XR09_GROCL|nr:2-dehydropantoate 2-reductase [Grosmannia clavigera kw1407]EFW99794.1 2-dehydropantoate 2-reductase [Grosmannia clavigera kw1407]
MHQLSQSGQREHGGAETAPLVDFDVEMWSEEPPPWPREAREITPTVGGIPSKIQNLIIATKAQNSLAQADWLRRYLGPESTVAFAQNGMNKLWPPHGSAYNRARYCCQRQGQQYLQNPLWLVCIVMHGVVSLGPFESIHASPAGVVVGPVGTDHSSQDVSSSYLVKQLLEAPQLNTRYAQRPELWVLQLEKLVVNSIINPLTTILRCKNGDLFSGSEDGDTVSRIMDRLIEEASGVFQCLVQYDANSRGILEDVSADSSHLLIERLSVPNLGRMLYDVGEVVKDNTSSMLQDARMGRTTEVREFNGWFVDTADYLLGLDDVSAETVDVTYHTALIELVESGTSLTRDQLGEHLSIG